MNTSRLPCWLPKIGSLIAPLLAALALAPVLLPASAQAATSGSGNSATENRSTGEFQAVALSGSMDLVVRQGPTAVQVQADDNLLPLLETVVESGSNGATLRVRWKKGESIRTRSKVLVTVSSPRLSALASAGSGDTRLETYTTPALKISLSGSGDVRMDNLSTDELQVSISGSSDVVGRGKATKLGIGVAGSGDVRLSDMQADDVSIRIAGSGDVAVNAQKTLDVRIAGSGDVSYSGNATVKSSVAGSGNIRRR